MKYGRPQPLKNSYYALIEAEINRIFWEVFYKPLIASARKIELTNASSPVTDAIASGQIWYEDGQFFGKFNAAISRELKDAGAHFNQKTGTWGISATYLPDQWRMAQAAALAGYNQNRQSMLDAVANMTTNKIDWVSRIPDAYIDTLRVIDRDFMHTIRAAYAGVAPQLTDSQRGVIAAEWGQNLDLYIRKFTDENILKLRKEIEASALTGKRSSNLVKIIQDNYNVSQNKAKFLARQETSLMLSKFHETRYRDLGSTAYRWSTSHDERVREDHAMLDGQIIQWDTPPVVDRQNGRRGHAGTDFGCRCVPIPIFD